MHNSTSQRYARRGFDDKPAEQRPARTAYRIKEFSAAIGISVATLYEMIARGELRSVKVAGARLIPASEMDRLLGEAA